MADDGDKLELYRSHRTATDKYVYFLLAAAGACIAFAINQTREAPLSWSQLPLGAAVLCWGLSFYFGCRQLRGVMGLLQENYELIRTMRGEHPEFPPDQGLTTWISKRLDEKSRRGASGNSGFSSGARPSTSSGT